MDLIRGAGSKSKMLEYRPLVVAAASANVISEIIPEVNHYSDFESSLPC